MPIDTPRMPSNKKSKSKKKLASLNAAATAPETTSSGGASPDPPVAPPPGDRAAFDAPAPRDVPADATAKKSVTETAPKATTPMKAPVAPEDVAPAISSTRATSDERAVPAEDAVSSSAECSKQEATAEEGTISVSANKRGVAFFDLDHTVIDTNSSWHWVQHEMHAGRVGAHMILTAIYWFARYAAGFGAGAERAGAEAAELYAGTLASDLEAEVNVFFDKHMRHRQRPGCEAAIEKHSLEGIRCLICTTSWQHPARAAAKLFGLETAEDDVISSVMEIDETTGCLTGKIETVAYGDGKYEVTKKWCDRNGVDLKDCVFYTDSMSDVLLMEHVGTPVAVNPDARLRAFAKERGWQIVDWGVAEARARKPRYSYGCLNFGGSHVGPG